MIEIKYRAWHWPTKRMLKVGSIHFSMNQVTGVWMDARSEETGPLSMESCQLMQFTGLCDMKGQDIYEGDIVDDTTGRIGIQQATLVVKWNEQEAGFSLHDPRGRTIWWKPHLQEVIGNIYENRSLLERPS